MRNTNVCYNYIPGGSEGSRPADMLQMCDKGTRADATADVDPSHDGFGGMHNGDGGNVLFTGGYVKWYTVDSGDTQWNSSGYTNLLKTNTVTWADLGS